jgi:hypothetical protein
MKAVRSMLAWWCLLLAAFAAAIAIVSRNAEKILYLDADRPLFAIKAEMAMYRYGRARGIQRASNVVYEVTSRELLMAANDGTLVLQFFEYGRPQAVGTPNSAQSPSRVRVQNVREVLSAYARAMAQNMAQSPRLINVRRFELPLIWTSIGLCAFSALLLVPPPLRRAIRRVQNRCVFCGYSLYGLTSDRCPECGNPFTRTEAAAGSPP